MKIPTSLETRSFKKDLLETCFFFLFSSPARVCLVSEFAIPWDVIWSFIFVLGFYFLYAKEGTCLYF